MLNTTTRKSENIGTRLARQKNEERRKLEANSHWDRTVPNAGDDVYWKTGVLPFSGTSLTWHANKIVNACLLGAKTESELKAEFPFWNLKPIIAEGLRRGNLKEEGGKYRYYDFRAEERRKREAESAAKLEAARAEERKTVLEFIQSHAPEIAEKVLFEKLAPLTKYQISEALITLRSKRKVSREERKMDWGIVVFYAPVESESE
jgi:hypothetical protein